MLTSLSGQQWNGLYDKDLPDYGDLMTRYEWLAAVEQKCFIDDDGFGKPVKDGKMAGCVIYPSDADQLPDDATHVMWFNK